MAAPNAARVGVGSAKVTGAIFVAPNGTAAPTDATTALGSEFVCIGYTSSDGITISESGSSNDVRAWEGQSIVYTTSSEYTEQIQITPIQIDADAYKLIWGDAAVEVDQTGNIHIKHSGATPEAKAAVIEMVPRAGIVHRLTAILQPASRDSVTYNGRDVSGRPTTFTCLTDENGYTMHEYFAFTA